MQRALNLVLAAWAGSLWTVCGIVAPSLFAVLPDRHLAGQVAAYFFHLETWVGIALGTLVSLLLARRVVVTSRFDYGLVVATMLAPLASELALRPLMEAARAVEDMRRFGMLHGLSALLFIVACITALLLVWRENVLPTTADSKLND